MWSGYFHPQSRHLSRYAQIARMGITMSRAHIYCRVSSSGQEDGYSLDTQEKACRAWAESRRLPVATTEREVWSGTDRYRARLDALLDRLLPGDLVAYALDRVSRNQVDTAILIDRIDTAGASLRYVQPATSGRS
jgi:DNA invertase Pin-like site-specific DNA recombinase